jgi:hypothetical protein
MILSFALRGFEKITQRDLDGYLRPCMAAFET